MSVGDLKPSWAADPDRPVASDQREEHPSSQSSAAHEVTKMCARSTGGSGRVELPAATRRARSRRGHCRACPNQARIPGLRPSFCASGVPIAGHCNSSPSSPSGRGDRSDIAPDGGGSQSLISLSEDRERPRRRLERRRGNRSVRTAAQPSIASSSRRGSIPSIVRLAINFDQPIGVVQRSREVRRRWCCAPDFNPARALTERLPQR